MKTIRVFSCPGTTLAEDARLQMQTAAEALHLQAADAHAEGMYLEGQSARIEQLTRIASDEEITRMRDMFVAEGLLEIDRSLDVSSPGGDA